jgi:hypothetical protein
MLTRSTLGTLGAECLAHQPLLGLGGNRYPHATSFNAPLTNAQRLLDQGQHRLFRGTVGLHDIHARTASGSGTARQRYQMRCVLSATVMARRFPQNSSPASGDLISMHRDDGCM